MATYATANTYDDKAMREDLLDVLTNIDPTETQLVSGLGKSSAKQIRHEWVIDTLTAVKDNAQIEGAAITYHNPTNPARIANYTQIIKQGFKVSDTERAVDTAGFNDRYNYEKMKALRMLKNDMEYALMRGSLATGDASAGARQMRGIKRSLSLVTSQSGVSLTELILNDYLENVWAEGTEVNAIYAPMYHKRKISAFTANSTLNLDAKDRRLVNAIDVYEADAATLVKLFAHRYVRISTDDNYDLVGIDEDLFKIAYLRTPEIKETVDGGDYTGGNFIVECTLEGRHYDGGFFAAAHL